VIGRGALGKVYLVEKTGSGRLYAMKMLSKSYLVKKNQRSNIKNERIILEKMSSAFITQLHYAFQN
jgi:serine/threonine protein kinase